MELPARSKVLWLPAPMNEAFSDLLQLWAQTLMKDTITGYSTRTCAPRCYSFTHTQLCKRMEVGQGVKSSQQTKPTHEQRCTSALTTSLQQQ